MSVSLHVSKAHLSVAKPESRNDKDASLAPNRIDGVGNALVE